MKPWFPFLILTLWVIPAIAGEPTIIKPDPLNASRYQLTATTGQPIGTVKPDPINRNRLQITDRAGNRKGYICELPLGLKPYGIGRDL